MYVLAVTIAATSVAQCIIPEAPVVQNSNTAFQSMYPQNQGTHNAYLGDYRNAGAGTALLLNPGGAFGGANGVNYASDLKEFFVYGTAGDVIVFMIFP